ncbi:DUF1963 domain-containing protein [Nannocystaceae bacterium ST9]
MHELDPMNEWLRGRMPVALAGGELTLGGREPALWIDEGRLMLALRTVTIDEGTILDVREQEVALGRFADHPIARWRAWLEGTLRAASAIVASLGGVEAILPFELFYFRVLADPSLASADEFAAALADPDRLAVLNQQADDEAWREQLEPCGLADRLAEVKALSRPSLRLTLEPIHDDDEAPELGGTRIGGDPDLPPSQAWPAVEGEPMVFVAQFDLAELAGFAELAELPRAGLLSFFYAPIPPRGQVLEHPVAVLHLRERGELVRRVAPEPRDRLRLHSVEFEAEHQLPMLESSFHYEVLRPVGEVKAFYESLARGRAESPPVDDAALARLVVDRSRCDFERPIHRLLGHPSSIQGDPYLDVEMCRRGWEGWREGSDEAMALRRQALGWRLLLQVDAEQDGELLLNQDGGFFYFWIPADALAVHDWSRVRGCLQCH